VNEKVAGIEVDFYWPGEDLVVEIDGPGHERPRTKAEDAARDRVLEAAGLTVVRIPSGHG
jgi:very-short-patch-repair endonuclease